MLGGAGLRASVVETNLITGRSAQNVTNDPRAKLLSPLSKCDRRGTHVAAPGACRSISPHRERDSDGSGRLSMPFRVHRR
jgi:hypothetical protein